MSSVLAALFGRIFNQGIELDLVGGLNFASPLKATLNSAAGRIDLSIDEDMLEAIVTEIGPVANAQSVTVEAENFDLLTAEDAQTVLEEIDGHLFSLASATIEEVLTVGDDANGRNVMNVGDGDGAYLTDANIRAWNRITAENGWIVTHGPNHGEAVGLYRITWFIDVRDPMGAVWGFEWLSHTHITAPSTATLRLSKSLSDASEMEGTPPDISISVEVASGSTSLKVTNNSGGDLDIRMGSIHLYSISPEVE